MHRLVIAAFAAVLAVTPALAVAGDLTPKGAAEVLDNLDRALGGYFDAAVSAKVRARLKSRRADYLKLDSRQALADAVSKDMVETSGDLHLKVSVRTLDAAPAAKETPEEEALLEKRLAHGLMAVRRLPGNIGYLKLRYFGRDDEAYAMLDSAVRLLADTDALIIDLRENTGGGGNDELLLGHLSNTPIPMALIHWRNADGTVSDQQREVVKPTGGAAYPDKPVFVLTANRTFSAAEGFAYDLQAARRAVLVGEKTRGGGNPSNHPNDLGYGMGAFIPNGWVEHPTTHGGWEGKGVQPDVPTAPGEALTEAYRRALEAARPLVKTPKSEKERADAMADPKATLLADQQL